MSELKAVHVVDVYDEYSADPYKEAQVYLKSEADKVIAEKDAKIQRLENLCESYRIDCDNLAIREANAYKEIVRDNNRLRHHKYMRYIDIAEWCACKSEYLDQYSRHTDYIPNIEKYKRKRNHYADRCNKLLLLAEKFKEDK